MEPTNTLKHAGGRPRLPDGTAKTTLTVRLDPKQIEGLKWLAAKRQEETRASCGANVTVTVTSIVGWLVDREIERVLGDTPAEPAAPPPAPEVAQPAEEPSPKVHPRKSPKASDELDPVHIHKRYMKGLKAGVFTTGEAATAIFGEDTTSKRSILSRFKNLGFCGKGLSVSHAPATATFLQTRGC